MHNYRLLRAGATAVMACAAISAAPLLHSGWSGSTPASASERAGEDARPGAEEVAKTEAATPPSDEATASEGDDEGATPEEEMAATPAPEENEVAEDAVSTEEAAAAIPLPPVSPRAADADEAEAPAPVASLEGHPMPRLRPADDDLPWRLRPVVDRATAQRVSAVLSDLFAKRFSDALAGKERLDDPAAQSLVEFLYVRDASSHAPWRRIRSFLDEHPEWPSRDLIERRFEVALFSQKAAPGDVMEVFAGRPPETNLGRLALAQAHMAQGRRNEARTVAAELWRSTKLTAAEEKLVDERLGELLTEADHRARAVRMVYTSELRDALSLAKRLKGDDQKLVEAAAKALQGDKKAQEALDKLPKKLGEQPVALFAKARLARRAGEEEEAGRILMKAPADEDALAAPDEWWLEQKLASRWLLERGRAKEAYALTLKHAAQSPAERSDAEWQAGWIALRFLDRPADAIGHFAEALSVVSLPISVSRGEYWLGRAHEANGDRTKAAEHYRKAGEHFSTYYGQLALERLGVDSLPGAHKPLIAHAALRHAETQEPVKAIRLLWQLGHESLATQLMTSLARETRSTAIRVGVAELAHELKLPSTTLAIGKLGTYAGDPTEYYSFTTDGLPAYPVIGAPVDPALVYAIARQESVFNATARSHAGAQGLMQLMPATARMTAQAYGQAYHESRLTQDPTYNVMIGAAHLGQLMERFEGSYPMVFAAYNAGGGRIYEWNRRFGDPRKGEIDPVDWVEFIPYGETRNYVQRVMEGMQVYRARLGDGGLRIAEDLGARAAAPIQEARETSTLPAPTEAGLSR
ncbi:lytic transglycosylase domain-containing protein [Lutibaculum baratangense]|uniref:Soluble lytic murein transglycosylase n=1 Tax=Lutibaculum baratangense AMV1 TaxID=631454 RepID=V4RAM1_9HYPH|nr:lytic transglycosylase domain-containing protein [Lutibaculum baratangense]ESR23226.1 Soluble lytic murein transglycosylase precursor [Lutibaculum baratangense AMV1]